MKLTKNKLREIIKNEIINEEKGDSANDAIVAFAKLVKGFPVHRLKWKKVKDDEFNVDITKLAAIEIWAHVYKQITLRMKVFEQRTPTLYSFSMRWQHLDGGSNGYRLGIMALVNGKMKWHPGR